MLKGLVSIVIPIYNVEKYLNRCMESVVNQTYTNLEIIMVDDGSTDSCSELCDEWKKKDKRIKVIHKLNAGLGMARNTGIENATGEYICFLDSDDYIHLDTIKKTYDVICKEQADIAIFGFEYMNRKEEIERLQVPCSKKRIYEGEEVEKIFLPHLIADDTKDAEKLNLQMSACACMYSMKMITEIDWRFVSEREIISEDVYSLLLLYKYVNKVVVISEAFYCYCINDTSLTHTYRGDRYDKIKLFYDKCIEACCELNYSDEVKNRFVYPYLSYVISALKMIVKANIDKGEKKKAFKKIIYDEHMHNIIRKCNVKNENFTKKVFFKCVLLKWWFLAYLFVWIKMKEN